MSEAMDGVEAVYMPEEEDLNNDIPSLVEFLNSKIQHIEQQTAEIIDKFENIAQTTVTLKEALQRITNLAEERERLNEQQDNENPGAQLDASFNEEKLSPTAKRLIDEVEGPLNPERFKEFLIEKSFGKPLPSILPIVRGYTLDIPIPELCVQLKQFRSSLKAAHWNYMRTHRLDCNLEKRIERLVGNIEKELKEEERGGRRQAAITDLFPRIQRRGLD